MAVPPRETRLAVADARLAKPSPVAWEHWGLQGFKGLHGLGFRVWVVGVEVWEKSFC